MLLGKVCGTVVATQKDENLAGGKLQILKLLTMEGTLTNKTIVAFDTVGAGYGEVVIVVTGSSSRMTERTRKAPVDATIVGIVDELEIKDKIIYNKAETKD